MSTNPVPDNDLCEDIEEQQQTGPFQDINKETTEQGSITIPDVSSSGEVRTLLDPNTFAEAEGSIENHRMAYIDTHEEGRFGTSSEPDIDDYFRRITGRYWAWNNNKVEYIHKALGESQTLIDYEFLWSKPHATDPSMTVDAFVMKIPSNYRKMGYYNESASIGLYRLTSKRISRAREIFSDLMQDMISGKNKLHNKHFTDHSFKIASPVQRRDIDAVSQFPNLLYANVNPTYNFYIPSYESAAVGISEPLLPNMYTFVSQMLHDENDEEATINPLFKKHLTLDNKIAFGNIKKIETQGQYFNIYSKGYSNWNNNKPRNSVIESKFKNQLVSHSNVNLLKDYNKKKELFPMFVDIKFSTDTNADFAELLKDTEMGCVLMKEFVHGENKFKQFREFLQTYEKPDNPLYNHGDSITYPDGLYDRNVIDITDWFSNISNISSEEIDMSTLPAIFLGNVREIVNDPKYKFFKSLMTLILNGRILQLSKKYTRTYKDILDGKLAHSETVAYRIEKKSGDTQIQNFYLPNSNEINIHNFIDTQVKYGKEYTYNIYALQAVYGTSYQTIVDSRTGNANTSYLLVYSKPSIKIVEVPYYDYTNRLLDSPPVQPNVEIIPFKGIDNRIKINLSSNTGKYDLQPIVIEASEEEENEILKLSQDRLPDEPLQYESDDYTAMFEVYRVDKHPSGYSDFKENKISVLNTDSGTAASMIDNILPNKKYWYIFRSVDNHNHVSYPTPIYQFEMINSSGAIFPLISVVDFKAINPQSASKKLKRIMQIAPAFPQTILNTEELDKLDTIKDRFNDPKLFKLGVEDESLWQKKFKIRLTSKKTGKKVDINIKFKHEHLNINPESD